MAEKKPMSLNERHQRFLSSQNRSNRPSSSLPGDEEKRDIQKSDVEGRRRLFKASSKEEPNFLGIMDFDSPPLKSTNVSDAPSFQGIMDFDSPPSMDDEEHVEKSF
ncbi:DNA helicase [Ranunculus cassubicifolius]